MRICKAVIRLGWPRTVSIKIITLKETTVSSIKYSWRCSRNGKISTLPKRTIRFLSWMQVWSIQKMSNLGWMSHPQHDVIYENKDRIAGVFLTHGHADAIGALPIFWLKQSPCISGTELTIEQTLVKSNDSVKKFNDFHVIDQNSEIGFFGDAVVSFFQTTHSSLKVSGLWLAPWGQYRSHRRL